MPHQIKNISYENKPVHLYVANKYDQADFVELRITNGLMLVKRLDNKGVNLLILNAG